MAADAEAAGGTIEYLKQELLKLLRTSQENDPLHFVTGEQSLQSLQDSLRSNIGRRKRSITFYAWFHYFLHGAVGDYPLDWPMGEAMRG